MLGTENLLLFVVTGLVLNATPGVDMAYTVTRTLQHGARGGVAAALGISTGCAVHAVAAALGLAALLAASTWAFDAIKWAGAAYLVWLAAQMARSALNPVPVAEAAPSAPVITDRRRIFVQGFLTNLLNPKVALFFLALLPQFIRADAADKPLAFLFLGAVFIFNGTLFLFGLVAVAHQMRRLGTSERTRRLLNALGATLFVALAARLALAER
ncbi:MAG TPA: LysE family translocator [Burkholderiaceae bacterium]|nr:LysE family translocator [Burkholderiaceae bacterium]